MILDALTQVCSAQAVTADAASEDSIDLGNVTPKRNFPVGTPLALLVVITAIGTNTGSAIIQAVTSAASALTSQKLRGAVGLETADIAVGQVLIIPFSQGLAPLRYAGAYFDITGTVDFTVDAWIGPLSGMADLADAYARGFSFDVS
jgi:hypothetical protein